MIGCISEAEAKEKYLENYDSSKYFGSIERILTQEFVKHIKNYLHKKEKYITFIRTALLKHIQNDNVVYHGLFGHFFLQNIHHVLKVRIVGDLQDRVEDEVKREGISADKAREIITRDDDERRKWAFYLYGADSWDATLYDLVIHLKAISVDDAVKLICYIREFPDFQTTPESQQAIVGLVEAARLEMTPVWWHGFNRDE